MSSIYDFSANTLDGKPESLENFRGKVMLIVNTASKCGFTPQYRDLEELYQKYRDRGLVVLGFPCNQFGAQEPGDSGQIADFCQLNYGVTFPMFEKVDVNGKDAHPLYKYLTREAKGLLGTEFVKWNFTKFLVDKNGRVIDRFDSMTNPKKLEGKITSLLDA